MLGHYVTASGGKVVTDRKLGPRLRSVDTFCLALYKLTADKIRQGFELRLCPTDRRRPHLIAVVGPPQALH
jgi:hypothetical protein